MLRVNDRVSSGRRPALAAFAALGCGLVLLRSFLPVWYEGFEFDSDQAVLGLMAKHLSELRTFPLFVYGQHYILGVQSWLAAPVFLLAGPTVFALRLPLVFVNIAIAVLVIVLLVREAGLGPGLAFVAALPFVLPTPMVSTELLYALGYSAEPLLYVLLLWVFRRRAIPFGIVLTIGFLHREFTAYALPALTIVMALDGTLFTRQTFDRLLTVVVVFALLWVGVEVAKSRVDVFGPSTGRVENAPLATQLESVAAHVCFDRATFPARLGSLWTDAASAFFGARRFTLFEYGINSPVSTGSPMVAWLLAALAALVVVRLVALRTSAPLSASSSAFCVYLAIVGLEAAAAYPFACDVVPGRPGVTRYLLLALFIPVAAGAAYLRRETRPALKAVFVAGVVAWTAFAFRDHAAAIARQVRSPEAYRQRVLANYLVSHAVKYSRAEYWDAYALDFLTREQVVVASTGKLRVREYETIVDAHRSKAVEIARGVCTEGGTVVDAWCLK
jgi:hypothetical protein